MTDFFHPKTEQKANKHHQCICCLYAIERGEVYYRQAGVYDGAWQDNKYHVSCWNDLAEEDYYGWEFTPGCGEPPKGARRMSELKENV